MMPPTNASAQSDLWMFEAVLALHKRMKIIVGRDDPAPWFNVPEASIEMFGGADPSAYVRNCKLAERTKLVLCRAMRGGALRAVFVDGSQRCDVPAWAWDNPDFTKHVWSEGRLPLDIFLPYEWMRWSGHCPHVNQSEFDEWMESSEPCDIGMLPDMALPIDLEQKPKPALGRTPPSVPFVSLSQALSWIAFGFSFDRMALYNAIDMEPFGGLATSQRALSDAVSRLATIATDGNVAMFGKYVHVYSSEINHVLTAPIEAVRFADFAQFDILLDGLRYGRGLTWVFEEKAFEQNSSGRPDGYRSVTVNRDDLMRFFPAKVVTGPPSNALITPGQSQSNQGGVTSVRRLSDRALAKWLADLSDGDKMKSQAALWGMCKSEHPDHFIARIRIRAHTPHRKRGRKPIGQKETA